MHRDTRKLLRHSAVTGVLLFRYAFRSHRYIYTLAVLLALWALIVVKEQRIACALLAGISFVLLGLIVEFLERRVLAPLRGPEETGRKGS
jgi:hypothetical protein